MFLKLPPSTLNYVRTAHMIKLLGSDPFTSDYELSLGHAYVFEVVNFLALLSLSVGADGVFR